MVNDTDRDKLVALMHGELNSVEAQHLTDRLRVEEDLRIEYEALLAIDDQLDALFVKPANEGFSRDQIDTILNKAEGAPKPIDRRRFFYTAGGAAMAASLALVLWTKQNVPKAARFSPPVTQEVMDVAGPAEPSPSPEKKMEFSERAMAPQAVAPRENAPAAPLAEQEVALEGSVSKKDFQGAESARDEAQDSDRVTERRDTEDLALARSATESNLRAKAISRAETPGMAKPADTVPMVAAKMLAKPKTVTSLAGAPVVTPSSSVAPSPAAPEAQTPVVPSRPKWSRCVAASDCVLVEEPCGWRAINKKFAKAFQELSRSYPQKKCEAPPVKKSGRKVQCKKMKCAY